MNRIKLLREEKNMTQQNLADKLGSAKSSIAMYENETRKPSLDVLNKLSRIFECSIDYIIGNSNTRTKLNALGQSVINIPILGTVKAGYNYFAQENWQGTIEVESKLAEGNDLFALNITGDSMFPVLMEGDIVIVNKQNDFNNGDIVVALIGDNQATIKKAKKGNNAIILQPLNVIYEPLIFTEEDIKQIPVEIIGVVKKLERRF